MAKRISVVSYVVDTLLLLPDQYSSTLILKTYFTLMPYLPLLHPWHHRNSGFLPTSVENFGTRLPTHQSSSCLNMCIIYLIHWPFSFIIFIFPVTSLSLYWCLSWPHSGSRYPSITSSLKSDDFLSPENLLFACSLFKLFYFICLDTFPYSPSLSLFPFMSDFSSVVIVFLVSLVLH